MEIRTSKLGREYQVRGLTKVPDTNKWVNRMELNHWCERVKFLDNGEVLYLFYDHSNKLYKKESEKPDFF